MGTENVFRDNNTVVLTSLVLFNNTDEFIYFIKIIYYNYIYKMSKQLVHQLGEISSNKW